MSQEKLIGSAVVPADRLEHDVMTVYDLTGTNKEVALCNWLIEGHMLKAQYLVENLVEVRRKNAKH